MNLFEELKELGVNIDEGMNRLMGNASLYERMLGSFAKMIKEEAVSVDFDGMDYADVIEKAHAIKGTSGNLSITPIYEAYSEIVRLLREDQPEPAREVLKKMLPVQEAIVQCIEKYVSC